MNRVAIVRACRPPQVCRPPQARFFHPKPYRFLTGAVLTEASETRSETGVSAGGPMPSWD